MKWFIRILPDEFFSKAFWGIAAIGALFTVLFIIVAVLTVVALNKNKHMK